MATYRIIAKTNGYIANRDIQFNGRTEIIVERELALKEAYKMLLDMFNEKYADNEEVGYAANWGIAVIRSRKYVDGATPTFNYMDALANTFYPRDYSFISDEELLKDFL